jgi:ADP-ribose pyrophosphatase
MNSVSDTYLSCLHNQSHPLGSHQDGEIEISIDPNIIDSAVKSRKDKKFSPTCQDTSFRKLFDGIGIVFEDEYLLVVRDAVIFRTGNVGTYIRVLERATLTGQTGVVILPIRDNLIFLNRIFRHATRRWEIELPRGYREEGDSPEKTVGIELLQEVGLEIDAIVNLGEIQPNTGLLAGSVQAYAVKLLPGQTKAAPEEGESISDTLTLTLDQVKQKILTGEIRDGFTISALYLAEIHNVI